jgi:hypothetical protein
MHTIQGQGSKWAKLQLIILSANNTINVESNVRNP